METKYLYRKARARGMTASAALAAVRRHVAGPLAEYRAKLAAWDAEPDKRRYAPGGVANRPAFPTFYPDEPDIALRELDRPQWMDHTGWYADSQQDELYSSHAWRLPRGRFLAGYVTSGGITRLDRSVYHDEDGAWLAADVMAESDAEEEREYDERWQAASEANDNRDTARGTLHDARMDACRIIRALRELRDCANVEHTRAILADRLRSARDTMHDALSEIEATTDRIDELDMRGEF